MKNSILLLLATLLTFSSACIDAPPESKASNNNNGDSCLAGQQLCDGACTTLTTNPNNCGACGAICQDVANAEFDGCVGGTCTYTCSASYEKITSANGFECVLCDFVADDGVCGEVVCDGSTHTYYLDGDSDGWGGETSLTTCEETPPMNYVEVGGDCDDTNTQINPEMPEDCTKNTDRNCNGYFGCDDVACFDPEDSTQPAACPFVLFVTSGEYNGNLSGLLGADVICQEEARAGAWDPNIKWRALATNSTSFPATSIDQSRPLVTSGGNSLFDSGEYFSESIDREPDVQANTNSLPPTSNHEVWTGTTNLGARANFYCNDWEVGTTVKLGAVGDSGTILRWLGDVAEGVEVRSCEVQARLYCISQPRGLGLD